MKLKIKLQLKKKKEKKKLKNSKMLHLALGLVQSEGFFTKNVEKQANLLVS